jgi:hypothetical protein
MGTDRGNAATYLMTMRQKHTPREDPWCLVPGEPIDAGVEAGSRAGSSTDATDIGASVRSVDRAVRGIA